MHGIGGMEVCVSIYGWADTMGTGTLVAMMPIIFGILDGVTA
jgi:hypothetical protein